MIRDYARLDAFLQEREKDVGFTLVSAQHEEAATWAIEALDTEWGLGGHRVLDVGCGDGENCVRFSDKGALVVGLSIEVGPKLLENAKKYDFDVIQGDQSFMNFGHGEFELVFARHVLEHSVMPYFTLCEYNRVLKLGYAAYVEVPAPNSYSGAEVNHNHYSVMGDWMWKELMARAGFEVLYQIDYKVGDAPNQDVWWGFFLKKVDAPAEGWAASHQDVEGRVVRELCGRYKHP